MAKEVQVSLITQVHQEGEVETYQYEAPGYLDVISDSQVLTYQEESGVQVEFRIFSTYVEMTRTVDDKNGSSLRFERQKTHSGSFLAQGFPLEFTVETEQLDLIQSSIDSQMLKIDYKLFNHGQKVGDYMLKLIFEA
ncbi:DUF1934 family protein [Holzapfeliella sp. He02]|uniref:DUF1934 family protein n=1 Tax=Holzapfeliella saturejae TaxID=3082953 RepID=A0ABU8SFA1_9LACO